MSNAAPHDICDGAPRLIVVSPHLDDAVLGCTGLLARCPGSIVCTVFAGEPAAPMHTQWDEAGGFADAHEAVRARKREDERALALCGATPMWLDFLDGQYGATPAVEDVARTLAEQFARFGAYLPVCPFGLWHSDHQLVGAACRLLLQTERLTRYIAYEDAIYRAMPGVLDVGFRRLEAERLRVSPMSAQAFGRYPARRLAAIKRRAVGAYPSQVRAFGPFPPDVERAERYWRVERRSNSGEREP
ncbi:PIG-L family deacetylase [Paraburkholderia sp. CNPSo 3076]|uniref:PIG-L deacetylase family protein n=1 Tax=Paraburkholderia sp. CNPSo 3076 TaxID=2940936 RepID=UPI0022596487|nr:PIG-L family deacetylase [Paraburkholderia sp. CNPSo 3076]MCX5544346.1 PIG-L family deacetylase [Paraburkholderia sp. CNPSo 3076]